MRYSDRPELWERLGELSSEVWPECNLHGDALNQYWDQLYTTFPEWQFVLFGRDPSPASPRLNDPGPAQADWCAARRAARVVPGL